jgi:hypothetical protein
MLADIFITYKDRSELFERSFNSLIENTSKDLYRLTLICDGYGVPLNIRNNPNIDYILVNGENSGLGPSINTALAHIDALNRWYESSPLQEDKDKASTFVCYCQDDLLYSDKWLERLAQYFCMFENTKKLGFASGVECIEHKERERLGNIQGYELVTKDWIRAAQMFARREYWMSMFPIPAFDPETGRKRARPNDGMGSGVDWWFVRNHENSVTKSGRTCLTVPGLVKHLGYANSTWLDREMPESDSDKRGIENDRLVEEHNNENLEKPHW